MEASHESLETVLSVGSFAFCSVAMIISNKLAISVFPFESTLTAIQMLMTVLLLLILALPSIHIGSTRDLLRWSLVTPFFAGWLLTSLLSVKYCSLTLVIVLRTMSPVFSVLLERLQGSQIERRKVLSSAVMLGGAFIYTHNLTLDSLRGAPWVLLNVAFSVLTRVLQRRMLNPEGDPVDISKTGCTLINNLLGLLPILFTAYLGQEFQEVPGHLADLDSRSYLLIALSCFVGMGISYTNIWCQSMISATSMLILINFNRFLVITVEATLLRDLLPMEIVGACIILLGALGVAVPEPQPVKPQDAQPLVKAQGEDSEEP